MEQYVNDALRLLKQLISTPSMSRLETQAADVMAVRVEHPFRFAHAQRPGSDALPPR